MSDLIEVLDIGARYGIHPSWKPATKVSRFILVDADPQEANRLQSRYSGIDNVSVLNTAVSNNLDEFSELNILSNPAMSSLYNRDELTPLFDKTSFRSNQTMIAKRVLVKNQSIDSIISDSQHNIDFIKLDIEGHELNALKSLSSFKQILGIRSEVCFSKGYQQASHSSFPLIHALLESHDFILLNFDYVGQGDHWTSCISENHRYGSLQSTDAVWIKNPKLFIESANSQQTAKLSIFCFLNHAPDIAIWMLSKFVANHGKKLISKQEKSPLLLFLKLLFAKHLYSLKWVPSQNLNSHKDLYESICDEEFPELNSFNESLFYNPLESF